MDSDDERLKELILAYRRGRDGFDALAVRVVQLYLSGDLLPPLVEGDERGLSDRLEALTVADVERALGGNLGTVPSTREEHQQLVADILAFVKTWFGG